MLQSLSLSQELEWKTIWVKPDQDGEVSGSSPVHTKDFKDGTYCSLACAGHNELE